MNEAELTALSIAIKVLTREGILAQAEVLKNRRTRLSLADGGKGGKGEAVYQVRRWDCGEWRDVEKGHYDKIDPRWRRITCKDPQAECAPREAQPVALRHDQKFAIEMAIAGHKLASMDVRALSSLLNSAPTPERAQPISDAMMDLVDRLGSEASEVEPRAWKHLLVYAPERADAEGHSEAMAPVGSKDAALTDDELLMYADDFGIPALLPDALIIKYARAILAADKEKKS